MILDKKQMSEEDVKLQFITPAILSNWTLDRVLVEITERLGGLK